MITFCIIFLTIVVLIQTGRSILDNDLIDTQQRTISRMEVGVQNQMDREKELLERIAHLEHHQATTIGLWATDRPDAIPKEIANLFFEIK